MHQSLEDELLDAFPDLFQQRGRYLISAIEHGNGWYRLTKKFLIELREKLQCDDGFRRGIRVIGLREKYGSLHVILNYGDEEIYKLIEMYQHYSEGVCETCSAPAELYISRGWLFTRCDVCARHQKHAGAPLIKYSAFVGDEE